MKRDLIREGYQLLEANGWSDLIDRRWESKVREELSTIPDITEDVINEILETVLW
jgi:hypothetical protein